MEAVISTLIWGVKCVSAQSEKAVDKLAMAVKESKGRLAELLRDSRFVDDLGDSDLGKEEILSLVKDADDTFQEVGLSCKGWSISGEDPPTEVCEEPGYGHGGYRDSGSLSDIGDIHRGYSGDKHHSS